MFFDRANTALKFLMVFAFIPVTLAALLGTISSVTEYFSTEESPLVWIEGELQRCTRNNNPASGTL